MQKTIVCLNSGKKLVEETADWLSDRVIDDASGAKSLARFCVVVPTAQSGRNLRLALAKKVAKRFDGKGLVPPMVAQPMQLARGKNDLLPIASRVQTGAAFLKFMEKCAEDGSAAKSSHLFLAEALSDSDSLLSFLDQLEDLWRLLGAGGLLMRDVPDNPEAATPLEAAMGDEADRWNELADFESAFFDFLHEHGLRNEAERLHDA